MRKALHYYPNKDIACMQHEHFFYLSKLDCKSIWSKNRLVWMRRRFTLCQQVALKAFPWFPRCKHMLSLSAALLVLIGSLFTAVQSSMYCWSNLIPRSIGLFRLWGSVRHVYKLNNWSNLRISAYWRCGPFEKIQFYLVNWFDRFTKKIRLNRTIRESRFL